MSLSNGLLNMFNDPWIGDKGNEARDKSSQFKVEMKVYLCYPGHGIMGHAIVVEATPTGCWLGVDIDHTFAKLTLLRPAEIYSGARCLFIQPMQEGVSILVDLVGRTIL